MHCLNSSDVHARCPDETPALTAQSSGTRASILTKNVELEIARLLLEGVLDLLARSNGNGARVRIKR